MGRIISSWIPILLLFVLSGCRSTLLPEKPLESYQSFSYAPKPSLINLPVEMKITELEKFLNRQLSGLIYEDNSLEDNGGDNLMVKAWKKDNIRITFNNGQFVYTVPLKLWIKAGWKVEKFGISLSDYREVNAEISLDFHSSLNIEKDWTVKTKTISDGYRWLSKPVLKLGPIDLPITFIADMIIKSNMETISSAIDEGMKNSLDLRTNAQEAWTSIQEPMLLDEKYRIWLKISPTAISAGPVTGTKEVIRHISSIQAVTECFTGNQPAYKPNSTLPNLVPAPKLNDNFLINLTSHIDYAYIDSITKAMLLNTSYSFGKRNLTIRGVEVYGGEDRFILETAVTGSINGKLYFSGKPAYRESDSSLVVNELEFHLKTRNILMKSASWLLNGGIEKLIQKKMSYPLSGNLNEVFNLLQESLRHYEIADGFYLSGRLNKMEVQQPVLTKSTIIVPVILEGKVSVGLANP